MLTETELDRLYARFQEGIALDSFDVLELIEMARKTEKYEAAMFAYGEQAHELAAKVVELQANLGSERSAIVRRLRERVAKIIRVRDTHRTGADFWWILEGKRMELESLIRELEASEEPRR